MRKSPRWMVLVDDRILELLNEEGPHSPAMIEEDDKIPYGYDHIANRCRKLDKHGLVRKVGSGTYVITEAGKSYLNGDLDSSQIDDVDKNGEDVEA